MNLLPEFLMDFPLVQCSSEIGCCSSLLRWGLTRHRLWSHAHSGWMFFGVRVCKHAHAVYSPYGRGPALQYQGQRLPFQCKSGSLLPHTDCFIGLLFLWLTNVKKRKKKESPLAMLTEPFCHTTFECLTFILFNEMRQNSCLRVVMNSMNRAEEVSGYSLLGRC